MVVNFGVIYNTEHSSKSVKFQIINLTLKIPLYCGLTLSFSSHLLLFLYELTAENLVTLFFVSTKSHIFLAVHICLLDCKIVD